MRLRRLDASYGNLQGAQILGTATTAPVFERTFGRTEQGNDPCLTKDNSEEPLVEADEGSTLGLVEMLLKAPARVDRVGRDETRQTALIPRFLTISVASYAVFGLVMVLTLNAAPAAAWPKSILPAPAANWHNLTMLSLPLAYVLGLIAANGVCLPSFYFYGLLAGVKMSMLQVTGQVVKGQAAGALMLVGILPIYVALMLGAIIFEMPDLSLEVWLYLGLILPFIAGLAGVHAIYRGVMAVAATLPPERRWRRSRAVSAALRPERRCRLPRFLRRLTVSWAAVYTAVSPVMIFRLWDWLSRSLGA